MDGLTAGQIVTFEELQGKKANFEPGEILTADQLGGMPTPAEPQGEEEKLDFAQRFGEDLWKRHQVADEIFKAQADGEQTWAETMLQLGGKVGVGGLFDFIGQSTVSAFRALPDMVEDPIRDGASWAAYKFLDTTLGQQGLRAAEKGMEAYQEFAKDQPRAARNIESVVNIGLLAAPVKKKPKSGKTVVGKTGDAFIDGAQRQEFRRRASFIDDLVKPKQTVTELTDQAPRTDVKGIFQTKSARLSPRQQAAADEIFKIEGVSPKNIMQKNYSVIGQEISKVSERLEKMLRTKGGGKYKRSEFKDILKVAEEELKKNPTLVGSAETASKRIMSRFKDFARQNDSTPLGLWKARKQFDDWVRSGKGDKAFDPNMENAVTETVAKVRSVTNDFIDSKAHSVAVKDTFGKLSNMYEAQRLIKTKLPAEANNIVGRIAEKAFTILPLRDRISAFMALVIGVGGFSAAQTIAPFLQKGALIGGATYIGGRMLISPKLKRGLGSLLNLVDDGIRMTKDADLVQGLRADRAALIQLIEEAEDDLEANK